MDYVRIDRDGKEEVLTEEQFNNLYSNDKRKNIRRVMNTDRTAYGYKWRDSAQPKQEESFIMVDNSVQPKQEESFIMVNGRRATAEEERFYEALARMPFLYLKKESPIMEGATPEEQRFYEALARKNKMTKAVALSYKNRIKELDDEFKDWCCKKGPSLPEFGENRDMEVLYNLGVFTEMAYLALTNSGYKDIENPYLRKLVAIKPALIAYGKLFGLDYELARLLVIIYKQDDFVNLLRDSVTEREREALGLEKFEDVSLEWTLHHAMTDFVPKSAYKTYWRFKGHEDTDVNGEDD